MANVTAFLAAIKNAVYGEVVRTAIHDSIEAMNDEVEDVKNVRSEFASDLNTCNEKAALAVSAAMSAQNFTDSLHSIIGTTGCEYVFSSQRLPIYVYLSMPSTSASNGKVIKHKLRYDSYDNVDCIREHKDSWYCFQAYYGAITSYDPPFDCPFDQLIVENCVNLTENPSATEFDDTFILPAVKDIMTRYYLYLPSSSAAEYCAMYVCDAYSTDDSHILAKLRVNKDTQILNAIANRGISAADKDKQLFLTPMISFQNAIIDLQS